MGISWRFVCVCSLVCNLVLQIVLYGKRRHEGKACKWLDAALLLLKTLSPGNSWLNNWFFFCLCVCLSYRIIGLLSYPMGNTWTFFTDCKDPKIIQNLSNERISVYTAFVLVCLVLYYAWKKSVPPAELNFLQWPFKHFVHKLNQTYYILTYCICCFCTYKKPALITQITLMSILQQNGKTMH